MVGFIVFVLVAAVGFLIYRRLSPRGPRVHDISGRAIFPGGTRAIVSAAKNPNYIEYLYVDKLSDKVQVVVSDRNTIMDLKGIIQTKQ